jgi:hypothetical protein
MSVNYNEFYQQKYSLVYIKGITVGKTKELKKSKK